MARRAVIGRGGSHADRYPAAAGARREPSDVPGSNGWRRPPRGGSDTAPPRVGCRGREPVPICVSAPDCRADFTPCDSSNLLKFSVFLEYEIIFQMQVVSPNLVGNSGRKWCAIGDRSVRSVSVQVCFSPNFGTRVLPVRSTVSHEICVEPWQQNYLSNEIGLVRFDSESSEKLPDK